MTMTDDPHDLDELLSRYLDGDATERERARIESDPALSARIAHMRDAIDLVGAAVDVPTFDLERIRSLAVTQRPTPTAVTDMTEARRQRGRLTRSRLLAAAAAFVLLAVAVTAIGSLDGADDLVVAIDDSADSGDTASFEMAPEGDDGSDDAGAMMADEAEESGDDTGAGADPAALDSAAADSDDSADDGAESGPAAAEDFAPAVEIFDRLPDELDPVPDLATLESVLAELDAAAVAEGPAVAPGDEFVDDLCDELGTLLAEQLPAGTIYLETAAVVVDGLLARVAIATGVDGTVVTIVFDDACVEPVVLGIDPA